MGLNSDMEAASDANDIQEGTDDVQPMELDYQESDVSDEDDPFDIKAYLRLAADSKGYDEPTIFILPEPFSGTVEQHPDYVQFDTLTDDSDLCDKLSDRVSSEDKMSSPLMDALDEDGDGINDTPETPIQPADSAVEGSKATDTLPPEPEGLECPDDLVVSNSSAIADSSSYNGQGNPPGASEEEHIKQNPSTETVKALCDSTEKGDQETSDEQQRKEKKSIDEGLATVRPKRANVDKLEKGRAEDKALKKIIKYERRAAQKTVDKFRERYGASATLATIVREEKKRLNSSTANSSASRHDTDGSSAAKSKEPKEKTHVTETLADVNCFSAAKDGRRTSSTVESNKSRSRNVTSARLPDAHPSKRNRN